MRNIKTLFITLGILLSITIASVFLFKFDDTKQCTVVNYQNNTHLLLSKKDSKDIKNANQLVQLKTRGNLFKIYITFESEKDNVNSYTFYCNNYLDMDSGTNICQVIVGKTCLLFQII